MRAVARPSNPGTQRQAKATRRVRTTLARNQAVVNLKGLGITLLESEEAVRRGDEALNATSPGASERRTSVEFYEVRV